jgi:adenylate cyclase
MRTVRVVHELDLLSPPDALWPLVSNTDRLNRALALPAIDADEPDDAHVRASRIKLFGPWSLRWKEVPFDFVSGRYFRMRRLYENSPVAEMTGLISLAPRGGGTRVSMESDITLRVDALAPLARAAGRKLARDMSRVLAEYDRSLQVGELPAAPRADSPTDRAQLESRGKALKAVHAGPASERLLRHLEGAADDELRHMRPFELADRWSLARLDVLAACLHSVKAGLLDLSWEVLCPNCAGPGIHSSLAELKDKGHCPSCQLDFAADLSESVELRFSAHPGVRETRDQLFCVGSPSHSRHALAQLNLGAGAPPRELALALQPRSYTLRSLCGVKALRLRPRADGLSSLDADLAALPDGAELFFKPGEVVLRLSSSGAADVARVEPEEWKEAAASASLVASLQVFRDLFSDEVLTPGVQIGVKRLALLFTDLKGSTELYEKVGDATAYSLVRDHFDYLMGIIETRRGAVVKTIGDAVMAVFSSPADALEAALDMQAMIGKLNERLLPRPSVVLKVGVHEGAAIAINSGGRLDYFGTTANTAARVQNESEGGDVVITAAMREDPAVAAVLEARKPRIEPFTGKLKGLAGDFKLWRLRV